MIGALGWMIYRDVSRDQEVTPIHFAPKNYYDAKIDEFGGVYISGTLTGEGRRDRNNTYAVSCLKRFKACFIASVEQSGSNYTGRMDNPYDYPIVKWTAFGELG